MHADIITTHEAETLRILRQPLGTDRQAQPAEAAHAATAVGATDNDTGEPFNWRDSLSFWAPVLIITGSLLAALVNVLGGLQ